MTHRILIVPDAVLEGEIGASYLDRAGLRVRSATTGVQALAIARTWRPDLILFGDLPDMTTVEFSMAVRETSPDIKLFLVTESVDQHAGRAGSMIADAQLVEPVEPAEALSTIATLLDVRVRRTPRIPVSLLARVEGLMDDEAPRSSMANILTLSEGGVLLEVPAPLKVGARGTIQFVLPGAAERITLPLSVQGLIDEFALHYGAMFLDVGEEELRSLRTFVGGSAEDRRGEGVDGDRD